MVAQYIIIAKGWHICSKITKKKQYIIRNMDLDVLNKIQVLSDVTSGEELISSGLQKATMMK